jgi:hypothetical protein
MTSDDQFGDFAIDIGDWCQEHADQIKADFDRYFTGFNGRHFERFSAMGDPNRFVATDILAVEALSVSVPPELADRLFDIEFDSFNYLLPLIPADKDIWDVSDRDLDLDSPAARLHYRLTNELVYHCRPRVEPTASKLMASKLMASKRPQLIPVIDTLVSEWLQPRGGQQWRLMRNQLADPERRKKIADVVSSAPGDVTLLRRIDVALWMNARNAKRGRSSER